MTGSSFSLTSPISRDPLLDNNRVSVKILVYFTNDHSRGVNFYDDPEVLATTSVHWQKTGVGIKRCSADAYDTSPVKSRICHGLIGGSKQITHKQELGV